MQHLGVDEALEAGHLVIQLQRRDVVLEGIGYPAALEPHVGHPLQSVPVLRAGAHLRRRVRDGDGRGAVQRCAL
jgi:hypothetical protein